MTDSTPIPISDAAVEAVAEAIFHSYAPTTVYQERYPKQFELHARAAIAAATPILAAEVRREMAQVILEDFRNEYRPGDFINWRQMVDFLEGFPR